MSHSIKQLELLNQGQPLAHMIAPECASEDLLDDMRVHVDAAIRGVISQNEFRLRFQESVQAVREGSSNVSKQ
mgnify:CR=1 FL=1